MEYQYEFGVSPFSEYPTEPAPRCSGDYFTNEYIEWLEEKVEELKRQFSKHKQTLTEANIKIVETYI